MTGKITSDTGPFTIIPEWVLDSKISHGALRLYGTIGRYTNSDNVSWPSRGTLAKRLRVSKDTVDRWSKELVEIGALQVTHRKDETQKGTKMNRSNLYTLIHVKQGVGANVRLPSSKSETTPSSTSTAQNDNQLEPKPIEEFSPQMDEAKNLCKYLKDKLKIEADISERWIVEMERLVRIDGRTPSQIRNCVDWLEENEFWSINCRSPQKLRKHWERLRLEAQRTNQSKSGKRAKVLSILDRMEDSA